MAIKTNKLFEYELWPIKLLMMCNWQCPTEDQINSLIKCSIYIHVHFIGSQKFALSKVQSPFQFWYNVAIVLKFVSIEMYTRAFCITDAFNSTNPFKWRCLNSSNVILYRREFTHDSWTVQSSKKWSSASSSSTTTTNPETTNSKRLKWVAIYRQADHIHCQRLC